MSEPSAFGFGQFVPGFDFLQNLSKTAAQAQPTAASGLPGMGNWVAPTLSIEDIDKRIQELKSVLFWLEQNSTALKATIQAMEVQKMTLTTLQSMNVNMADLAKAFTVKPPMAEPAAAIPTPAHSSEPTAPKSSLFTPKATPPVFEPEAATPPEPAPASHAPTDSPAAAPAGEGAKPAVDPMQWWGALTQQFQGIAAAAMKDVAGEAMKAGMAANAVKAKKTKNVATAAKTPPRRKTAAAAKNASRPAPALAPRRAKAPARSAAAPSAKPVRAAAKSAASARQPSPK